MNPYVGADAPTRYSPSSDTTTPNQCSSDHVSGSGSAQVTTSFALREQSDSQNPKIAPIISGCVKQFAGHGATVLPTVNDLKATSLTYDRQLAQVFHNWYKLCTFTPTRSGDYYLQVRTNVALGGSGTGLERSGNMAAVALTGDTTSGEGSNAFALRAVTASGKEKEVAVAGYEHMPIFINADTATASFNLIRVLPGAAGQSISFSFFDGGDAAAAGTVKVLAPTDAAGSITTTPFPGSCKATGGSAGSGQTLTACTANLTQTGSPAVSRNNGKTETIIIPIPSDYTCNYNSFGGCWYRVQIDFGTGSVHDVTTWDATIIGDPVRLIK
jgi:hypothetical protein